VTRPLRLTLLIIVITALAAAARVIQVSFDPAQYHRAAEELANWTHPAGSVALFTGFVLGEAAIACIALWTGGQTRLWRGAVSALVPLALWSFFPLMFSMHAPGFMLAHHMWLLMLIGGLAVLALSSGLLHTADALRALSSRR
jgi:hypothetical protein